MTLDQWIDRARQIPIEEVIAQRGIQLKGRGAERSGPCPVCGGDDRFSINTAKGLWNCRGCGRGGDPIDLERHIGGVGFLQACENLAKEPPPKSNGKDHAPHEVTRAAYDYLDEDGKTLFVVGRIEYRNADGSYVLKDGKRKKTFRQKRYNVDGVRVVPYRLAELLAANQLGQIVFIAEGEAKVDLLHSWGLAATCNAMGAGKWRSEHSEFLNGADVVILPDNDEPGRAHAAAVATSLKDIASDVRIIEIPGLGPKEDLVDWAKRGGDRQQWYPVGDSPLARRARLIVPFCGVYPEYRGIGVRPSEQRV
jgi:putative DNA primase/helicase